MGMFQTLYTLEESKLPRWIFEHAISEAWAWPGGGLQGDLKVH